MNLPIFSFYSLPYKFLLQSYLNFPQNSLPWILCYQLIIVIFHMLHKVQENKIVGSDLSNLWFNVNTGIHHQFSTTQLPYYSSTYLQLDHLGNTKVYWCSKLTKHYLAYTISLDIHWNLTLLSSNWFSTQQLLSTQSRLVDSILLTCSSILSYCIQTLQL